MSGWMIMLIIIVLVIAGVAIFYMAAPVLQNIHSESMAPIRGIVGNPDSAKALAAFI